MKFTLIKNAKDSLEHAIEHFVSDSDNEGADLKRVILDVAHALELLLKERLIRIHPAFVYSNVDSYPNDDPHTVATGLAIKRLMKLVEVEFTKDDIQTIKNCKKIRNKIEHFEFELDAKKNKLIAGKILSFIISFSKYELNLNWESEFVINPNWERLKLLSSFWEEHSDRILKQLEKDEITTEYCPLCSADTLDIEEAKCHLCGFIDLLIECRMCEETFLESSVGDSELELCSRCEYEDGYASSHFEKY